MNQNNQSLFWLAIASIFIAGCDGNDVPTFGPEQKKIYSGQFLDSAVANLDYSSATQAGTTDAKGIFSYQEDESVTFAVGNITLGTAAGQAIITPVDLIPNSSSSTAEVQNISRFLLALDQDDDPRNGITISPAVRSAAGSWTSVDFSATDFDSQIAAILAEAGSVDGRTVEMPSSTEAKEHLEKSIFCAYGGGFIGIFSGSSSQGEWMLVVDDDGNIAGVGSDNSGTDFRLNGELNADSSSSFWADFYPDNATQPTARWEGNIYSSGSITGSWNNNSQGEILSLAGNRKLLALPNETKGDIYKGTIQLSNGTVNDAFNVNDVGIIVLAVDNNTVSGKGYLYSDNTEFVVPNTTLAADNFGFEAVGKEFLGRIEEGGIILGLTDLATGKVGGGTACKTP